MDAREQSAYHMARARIELDLGFRAEHQRVAEAHIGLSALHMQRMKELDEACSGVAAPAFSPKLRALAR